MNMVRMISYHAPGQLTAVAFLEQDLVIPLQECFEGAQKVQEKVLVIMDVFPVSDDLSMKDVIDVTSKTALVLLERSLERSERESNMAILYFWYAMQLAKVNENGILTATLPSPLSVSEIEMTLKQLAVHPNYKHQLVTSISEDMKLVMMRDGTITITMPP